jgi:hypothetical protein
MSDSSQQSEAPPESEAPQESEVPQTPEVPQPVTDNTLQVRQLSHYQFSWLAGDPGESGTWTLQLVLDQGAWEEVLTVDDDDADVLQELLSRTSTVYYDVARRT